MRQRAMIAMAMAMNPALLIADEPTTALDVTVQAQVLRVMGKLQREFGTALIMITHDLGVIADIADDVVVMYAGAVMERTDRRSTFYRFHHPYTEGLLLSLPVPGRPAAAHADSRPAAKSDHVAERLPVPSPLSIRLRSVSGADAAAPRRAGRAAHVSACWLPTRSDERDRVRNLVRARGQRHGGGGE